MLVAGLISSVALLFGRLAEKILAKMDERKEANRWRDMTHRRNYKFYA